MHRTLVWEQYWLQNCLWSSLSSNFLKSWAENYSLVQVAGGMFRLTRHYYPRHYHQVLPLCLHTDFWEWLRIWISISSRDPLPLPSSSTGCSWGLEHISQISDLISCVKPQITLGHLNSKPAEVKSWLSYIPPCPNPTSSAKSAQIACIFIGTSNNEQAQAKTRHRITRIHLKMEIRAHPYTLFKNATFSCFSLFMNGTTGTQFFMPEACISFFIPFFLCPQSNASVTPTVSILQEPKCFISVYFSPSQSQEIAFCLDLATASPLISTTYFCLPLTCSSQRPDIFAR